MDDLISRQAAIDALHMHLMYRMGTDSNKKRLDEWINNLPSAQPDNQINLCDSCDYSYPECPAKYDDVIFGNGIGNDNICACNKYKPSAQSEQRWIPCSKRLPDDLTEVNVTYVNHDPEPYYASTKDKPFTGSAIYYEGNWYWYSSTCADYLGEYGRNDMDKVDDMIEITAWRPLPEPYRGGDE